MAESLITMTDFVRHLAKLAGRSMSSAEAACFATMISEMGKVRRPIVLTRPLPQITIGRVRAGRPVPKGRRKAILPRQRMLPGIV